MCRGTQFDDHWIIVYIQFRGKILFFSLIPLRGRNTSDGRNQGETRSGYHTPKVVLSGYKIRFIYLKNPRMKLLAQNWLWMKI
jgi:hypothetical protein